MRLPIMEEGKMVIATLPHHQTSSISSALYCLLLLLLFIIILLFLRYKTRKKEIKDLEAQKKESLPLEPSLKQGKEAKEGQNGLYIEKEQ